MSRLTSTGSFRARALIPLVSLMACALTALCAAAKGSETTLVETQAAVIMQDIMDGITQGDYEKYTKDFSETMRKTTDRESFLQLQSNLRKTLGKFKSLEYLGFYVQENLLIALFKARFSKEKDDVLVNLVLDRHKEPKVTGLWFEAPSLRK